jgi:hypothetical protein
MVCRKFSLIWLAWREGNKLTSRDYFRETTRPFFFEHHFWHVFWLTFITLEVLWKVRCGSLIICSPSHPMLSSTLKCFMFCIAIKLGLPHPLAFGLTHCIYGWPLNPIGIHLLCCAHGGERTTSHDVVQDVFASIARMYGLLQSKNQLFFFHKFLTSFLWTNMTI